MKNKLLISIMLTAMLVVAGCTTNGQTVKADPNASFKPVEKGVFSVSPTKKVRFASGNLEYDVFYRFAAHQYDYGGYFGWGTGSNPTETSTKNRKYKTFDDWGSHIEGGWRTLSHNEWEYVISGRKDANNKRGAATVCGVNGLILLPDNWNGEAFHSGFNEGYNTNVYDSSTWAGMESSGAIFLPAADYREGTETYHIEAAGYYWSSTPIYEYAYGMGFDISIASNDVVSSRYGGRSVRLVQDY